MHVQLIKKICFYLSVDEIFPVGWSILENIAIVKNRQSLLKVNFLIVINYTNKSLFVSNNLKKKNLLSNMFILCRNKILFLPKLGYNPN